MFGENVSQDDPIVDFLIEVDQLLPSVFTTNISGLLLDTLPFLRFLRIHPYSECMKVRKVLDHFYHEWLAPIKVYINFKNLVLVDELQYTLSITTQRSTFLANK